MDKHYKEGNLNELFEDAKKRPGFQKIYEQFKPLFEVQNFIIEEKINKGLSSKQLAVQIGISQREFNKLEQADVRIRLETLLKVAEHLKRNLQIIFK